MQTPSFFLQFVLPLALVSVLVWRFVLLPITRKTMARIEQETEAEKIRERIRTEFADQDSPSRGASPEEELAKAIEELKDNQ